MAAARIVWVARMNQWLGWMVAGAITLALALAPLAASEYGMGILIGVTGSVVLAQAWAMFSGPTRYVSLATVAFFGIGAYTVAVLSEIFPFWLVLIIAACVGLIVSLIVGLSTLRLAGIYFLVFTLGLAELIRQLMTWYEVNVTGTMGRYIFAPIEAQHIFWMLLALACGTQLARWFINRSRWGLAIQAIGDDEVVAKHCAINVTQVKLALFALSSVIITLAGAIQAPRWVYVEPSIVFNPVISFLALIMALLGGANRFWGPLAGALPLFFLFEWLSANYPKNYYIILGLAFMLIVFIIPNGILDLFERIWARRHALTKLADKHARGRSEP